MNKTFPKINILTFIVMLQLTTKLMNMFIYFITKYILFLIIKITILVVISIQCTKHNLELVSHISLCILLKGLKGDSALSCS